MKNRVSKEDASETVLRGSARIQVHDDLVWISRVVSSLGHSGLYVSLVRGEFGGRTKPAFSGLFRARDSATEPGDLGDKGKEEHADLGVIRSLWKGSYDNGFVHYGQLLGANDIQVDDRQVCVENPEASAENRQTSE